MRRTARAPFLAVLLFASALTAVPARAGDWPGWRGPEADGTSPEKGLPLAWDVAGEDPRNLVWKVPLPGVSGSTPVVSGERIFLNVADGDTLSLWALDRANGEVLWRRELSGGNERKYKGNLSSPTPVTDGRTVWAVSGTGIVAAFDFAGKPLWRKDLQADYGPFGVLHGYASSPLLYGDALILQVLHGFHHDDPSYVLALDGATGTQRWRVERPTDAPKEAPDAYTTPALLRRDGREEIVVSGADYVTGHDPKTGRELWRVPGLNPAKLPMYRVVASPLVVGDVLVTPTRVKPMLAFDAGGAEGAPKLLWSFDKGPDVPTPVSDGTYLYVLTDNGILWCLELKTGEVVWGPERVKSAAYSASPLLAEGRLYVTSERGETTVLAAGPKFEVLATNDVGENVLASLAAAGGRLYLRTAEHLYCLDEMPAKKAEPASPPGKARR